MLSERPVPGSDAHLFDPGSDAIRKPQLSGCSLTGAQDVTDLSVGETVLFDLQQQISGHRGAAGHKIKNTNKIK